MLINFKLGNVSSLIYYFGSDGLEADSDFKFVNVEEGFVIGLAPRAVVWHPGWPDWVAKPGWKARATIGLPRTF